MAQVKIYGLNKLTIAQKQTISDVIHDAISSILQIPKDKRFHRFLLLEKEDFIFPPPRTEQYIIIEIHLIAGRSKDTKKALINHLFKQLSQNMHISVQDIEITIIESPAENWGFRGMNGDDAQLNYKIDV